MKTHPTKTAKANRFVVLLRGVNVGKGNRVPMALFKKALEEIDYTDVLTLLNSGNAIFNSTERNIAKHVPLFARHQNFCELGTDHMGTNETTLPFFLGSHRAEVENHIGTPESGRSEFGEDIQLYPKYGLTIKYKDELVIEIQSNGSDFQGTLCNVRIGDPIEKHRKRLGEPMSRRDLASSTKLTWAIQDFFLVAEIWNETGNEEGIGAFVKDHVREVELKSRLLTPTEERARCAEIFRPMFPGMSLEQIEAILLRMESKSSDEAEE